MDRRKTQEKGKKKCGPLTSTPKTTFIMEEEPFLLGGGSTLSFSGGGKKPLNKLQETELEHLDFDIDRRYNRVPIWEGEEKKEKRERDNCPRT